MTEKNNIEHIFQEKLASHEVNPPEIVWTNIEEKLLEKKKKRRIIPFWWKFSGVAALFAVGFFAYNTVNNENANIINNKNQDIKNENSIVNSKTNSLKTERNSQVDVNNLNEKNQNVKTENSIVNTKTNSSKTEGNSQVDLNNLNKNSTLKTIQNTTNSLVNNEKLNTEKIKNKKNIQNFKTKTSIEYVNSSNDVLITNKTQQEKVLLHNDKNTNNLSNQLNPNDKIVEIKNNTVKTDGIAMKNQIDNVVQKGEINTKQDSTAVTVVEPNAMEELLNEKEKKKTKEQKLNRWQVTPYLAPVFFGSFNNGSPLDASLAENTKTYNTNMSYGMNVNYSINKKFNVRTGVNVLSFSYNTQDIVFYQDVNAKMMKNISPNTKGEFIQIKPLANVNTELNRVTNERFDGVLNQQMGYIEVPMEFSYKLIDKKIGLEFIGGLSTLFLNKNDIFLKADETVIKIGTASNLNNLNFSSNIGLGIKYSIFKNFDTRIEPIFKYQFNTFSQDSGNFKPYIFGVYTGLSYKF